MAVTHTEESLLDPMSTVVLIARLHSEGKLRPVFDEAMGTHVFVDLETGQVNMTQGHPVFSIDSDGAGSNYLTLDRDLLDAVAELSGMPYYQHRAFRMANNRLVLEEKLTERAYDCLVSLIGYIDNKGA